MSNPYFMGFSTLSQHSEIDPHFLNTFVNLAKHHCPHSFFFGQFFNLLKSKANLCFDSFFDFDPPNV